jgi:hypothetical protein
VSRQGPTSANAAPVFAISGVIPASRAARSGLLSSALHHNVADFLSHQGYRRQHCGIDADSLRAGLCDFGPAKISG